MKVIPWILGGVAAVLFIAPYVVLSMMGSPSPPPFLPWAKHWVVAFATYIGPIAAAICWRSHSYGRELMAKESFFLKPAVEYFFVVLVASALPLVVPWIIPDPYSVSPAHPTSPATRRR